ncbi:hypothetical protein BDW59DRAFT_181888 [Aspergillus cavernicola]|uniref:Pentatricopeptide repeat domain-containing protein n=1 Tax=Aspergillus cavernicola TaxID=176166 RepID=A0ABR4HSN6_9EURO
MRPALLRLLRRPSALSVIDSLISPPFGITHLGFVLGKKCIHCQSSSPRLRDPQFLEERPLKNDGRSTTSTKPSSFRVHGIQSPSGATNSHMSRRDGISTSWKELGLQPERLDYESDIGHHTIGTRLVDDPIYQTDFSLWLELLRYRQRRYGDHGTLDIWKGLVTRAGGLHLPMDGESADILWQSFVDLGLNRETILKEVADYALELWNKTGKRWPNLYQSIVGGLLERGMTSQAVHWHRRLQVPHLSNPSDIIQCFKSATFDDVTSAIRDSSIPMVQEMSLSSRLSALREICKHTDGHRIYSRILPALVERGEFTEAFRMHFFLAERGDHARCLEELQPLLEYAQEFGPRTTYENLRRYSFRRFKTQPTTKEVLDSNPPPTPKRSHERIESDWAKERQFKDGFGARVFATKALTFDMILSGLKIFSVSAIGPQSLREMATRARGSHDLLEKLRQLDKEGISIGNGIFARLLRRLATENREILLSDLLHSDQHPDMFEDPQTQESLLVDYYTVRDWRQYNLTLAVLKELLGGGPDLINVHIRKHIAAGELTLASKVVDDLLTQGGIPTNETITFMAKHILTPRKVGAGPVRQPGVNLTHELAFVLRFLQRIAQAGAYVPPLLWIELIKRFGMTDCWEQLRTCCLWLTRHYSSSPYRTTAIQPAAAALARDRGQQMLNKVFTPQMQDAIVAWGFIIQPPSRLRSYRTTAMDDDRLVPFVRGTILLRELEKTGIQVRLERVARVCRQRLVMLYGRPVPSNRPRNRELRRENPFLLDRVIADVNRAWGEPPLLDDQGKSLGYAKTPRETSGPGNRSLTLFLAPPRKAGASQTSAHSSLQE